MPIISPTAISPFRRKGGVNWSSYWTTREPSGVAATITGSTTATVTWTDSAETGADGYKVYAGATLKETVAVGVQTADLTGLTTGTQYVFKVVAYKDTHESTGDTDTAVTWHNLELQTKGNGTGISPIKVTTTVNTTLTLDGAARFYSDAAATLDESTTWAVTTGAERTRYIKVPSGNSNLTFPNVLYITGLQFDWVSPTNACRQAGDIGKFLNATKLSFGTDVNCLVSGDISGCTSLITLLAQGSTTLSGDITLMTGLVTLNVSGTNTITGDLSDKTSPVQLAVSGSNTLYGDLGVNHVINGMTSFSLTTCRIVEYTGGGNTFFNMNVTINPAIGYGMDAQSIDAMLIDMAASSTLISKTITLQGSNSGRTAASDAAVATLTGVGRTNTLVLNTALTAFDNGKVVFTSDGGYKTSHDIVEPMFATEGIAGTFYITTNQMGAYPYMSWADVIAMDTAGQDMQCHTNTHTALTSLTQAQVEAEYDAVDAAFVAHGLTAPRHTAYPWGASNTNVQTWTATKRDTARSCVNGVTGANSSKFVLRIVDISNSTDINLTTLHDQLDFIKAQNLAIIFLFHGVDLTGTITSAQLQDLIDYAQSIGIDILTMEGLYALM